MSVSDLLDHAGGNVLDAGHTWLLCDRDRSSENGVVRCPREMFPLEGRRREMSPDGLISALVVALSRGVAVTGRVLFLLAFTFRAPCVEDDLVKDSMFAGRDQRRGASNFA